MAIVEKKKQELASKNLTPISISIGAIEDVQNQLEYAKVELEKQEEVIDMNVKLALAHNTMKAKYEQLKIEYDAQIKHIVEYQKITKSLNFILMCTFLQAPLTIYECNERCASGVCSASYDCLKRIQDLKAEYHIP